jgi:hypothetical protein
MPQVEAHDAPQDLVEEWELETWLTLTQQHANLRDFASATDLVKLRHASEGERVR